NRDTRAREVLQKHGLSAMLFTDIKNIRYLTGFTGTDGVLLVTATAGHFLTDSRY
ncbi:MAG: aminopeptidase P family protein, partial [Nitrospinaceae bacterium]|nr:aminopeptidase P family protein [Nitrospinaceae bacterium]